MADRDAQEPAAPPDPPMTGEDANRAHLRGPDGNPDHGFRRMQELRKISRDYPFICPVDFKPHKGSPLGSDPNADPDFIPSHREDDGAHYLGQTDGAATPPHLPMMQSCDHCGARMPQLPVRIEIVRESGPIGLASDPAPGETTNFTRRYAFCSSDHLYAWARERRYMLCNREPTPFEEGMQPYLPSRHMGGRVGLCDGHHTGPHEWKEAWPS